MSDPATGSVLPFSKALQDFVTCPLCLELFTHPVTLPCLHTFCQACIRDQVQLVYQSSLIQCPACSKDCSINEIRDDARAQSLLEIYEESKLEEEDAELVKRQSAAKEAASHMPPCDVCPDDCQKPAAEKRCLRCHKEMTPLKQDVNPSEQEVKPNEQEVASQLEELTLNAQEVASKENEVTQNAQQAMEIGQEVASKEKEVTQNVQEVVESAQEVASKEEEVAEKEKNQEVLSQEELQKKEVEAQIADLFGKVNQLKDETNRRQQMNSEMIAMIKAQGKEQIAMVRRLQHEELRKVDEHHDRLLQNIDDNHSGVLKHLEHGQKMKELHQQKLQEKIDFARRAVDSYDIHTLTACEREFSPEGMAEIEELGAEMARFNDDVRPRELVLDFPEWDPSKSTKLRIDSMSLFQERPFIDIQEVFYTETKCMDLKWDCYAERMRLIHGSLWFAAYDDGVYVYDGNCRETRVIKPDEIRKVRGVTVTAYREIIVACDESIGLVRLNPDGTFRCVIAYGSFSDVVCTDEVIYALEYESPTVFAYELDKGSNKWEQTKQVTLGFVADSWDKIVVRAGKLYVSSVTMNSVFEFDAEGKMVESYSNARLNATGGEGKCPILCAVDVSGEPLICDFGTGELLFHSAMEGTWHPISVSRKISQPMGVVMDELMSTVWVVTRNKELLKFSKNK